jgi:hypothetical protein
MLSPTPPRTLEAWFWVPPFVKGMSVDGGYWMQNYMFCGETQWHQTGWHYFPQRGEYRPQAA